MNENNLTINTVMEKIKESFADIIYFEQKNTGDEKNKCFTTGNFIKFNKYTQNIYVDFYELLGEAEYNKYISNSKKVDFEKVYGSKDAKVLCVMLEESVPIYEYTIDDGEIVKYKHAAHRAWREKNQCTVYYTYTGKSNRNFSVMTLDDMDIYENNRLFSFVDNIDKYSAIIIAEYEKRTLEMQQKVDARKEILRKLKDKLSDI